MASASDIEEVRLKVDEPTAEVFSDEVLGALIDALGVTGTIADVWETKAARFAKLVDVSEAGASHKMSDLFKNAQAMALQWRTKSDGDVPGVAGRVRVHVIDRIS